MAKKKLKTARCWKCAQLGSVSKSLHRDGGRFICAYPGCRAVNAVPARPAKRKSAGLLPKAAEVSMAKAAKGMPVQALPVPGAAAPAVMREFLYSPDPAIRLAAEKMAGGRR